MGPFIESGIAGFGLEDSIASYKSYKMRIYESF